jgi:hypothetical protein
VVDGLVFGVAYWLLALALGDVHTDGEPANWVSNLPVLADIAYGLFIIGYYALLEGYLGQTLGKMATGIKVVTEATRPAPRDRCRRHPDGPADHRRPAQLRRGVHHRARLQQAAAAGRHGRPHPGDPRLAQKELRAMAPSQTLLGPDLTAAPTPTREGMTPRTLRTFFALAFGLGWGTIALLVVFTTQIEAIFGPVSGTNPVFILAVYSPAIAAVFLIWRHYGVKGLGRYLRRATLWRMPGAWWLLLVFGIPAVKYLGAAINGTWADFPFSPWTGVLPALAAALLIGPVEEFGWRGPALPLPQRRWAPA